MKKIVTFEAEMTDEQAAEILAADKQEEASLLTIRPVHGSFSVMDAPRVEKREDGTAAELYFDDEWGPILTVGCAVYASGLSLSPSLARQFAAALHIAARLCEQELDK